MLSILFFSRSRIRFTLLAARLETWNASLVIQQQNKSNRSGRCCCIGAMLLQPAAPGMFYIMKITFCLTFAVWCNTCMIHNAITKRGIIGAGTIIIIMLAYLHLQPTLSRLCCVIMSIIYGLTSLVRHLVTLSTRKQDALNGTERIRWRTNVLSDPACWRPSSA